MTADSRFNIPREGGVAYAAQESWVQNDTIRETFYFGRLLMRYATAKVSTFFQRFTCTLSPHHFEVLRQCALEKGLELFEAVANTEVGEKGLTLVKKDQ